MRRLAIVLSLLGSLLFAQPAAAQNAGFAETAVAACAGGAMIGYLAVLATGTPSPVGTAAMFCGLSVAATAASTAAVWTWQRTTAYFY